MKRFIDILLVLILVVAIGSVFFLSLDQGGAGSSIPSATSTTTASPTATLVASNTPTDTLIPTSVIVPTDAATLTLVPAATATPTLTATPTPTPTYTPTGDPMQSSADLKIHDGIQAGNQIVKAIEAYHQAESRYPLTLDDLVPTYLSVIPLKGAGQGFYYRWFGNTGPMAAEVYWLAFKVASQDHLVCTYYRRLAYWDCNYESP